MRVQPFIFNYFSENTYVLYDESGACVIVDPGCSTDEERAELTGFISSKNLTPVKIIQTHTHVDHIMGTNYLRQTYNIPMVMHEADLPVLRSQPVWAGTFGINIDPVADAELFVAGGDTITFGNSKLEVLFTPGHSAGSVSFYSPDDKWVLSGDVLFHGSVGRTDFPFCSYPDLMHSITNTLFALSDDTKVYSGHGPVTNIGQEKRHNPFVQEYLETQNA